ncbi:MAG TPA: hypothetical protein PK874_06730 [Desulfobacteraceae bacterium]|nr:hypothetical protein [Desulfobacteraceae bacterium]HPJ66157.1 hypothetical protein [Desulfobacteraceae bacterium]HPQ27053.1 hypothetical protein [Desulfobacteraceae bacterium]
MISINATLILQVVQFVIFVFILNRLMLRPVLKILRDRSEHVNKIGNEIKEFEHKFDDLIAEYASTENEARKKAMEERNTLKTEAMAKANELFNNTKDEISSIRDDLDKEIKKQIEKIRPSLKREADNIVDEITEKIVGRRIAA